MLRGLGKGDLVEYATLQAGLSYLDTGFGYWAYRRIGGVDITLGGPVCAPGDRSEMLKRFLHRSRRALLFYLPESFLPLLGDASLHCAGIGSDRRPSLEPLLSDPPRVVQGALRHARRAGLRWVEREASSLGPAEHEAIRRIDAAYLARAQCSVEMSFLNRPVRPVEDRGRRFIFLETGAGDGGPLDWLGYAALNPIFRQGAVEAYLLDALRFRPTRIWGLWLSTVHHLAGRLSAEGLGLHLGYAPLHEIHHPTGLRGRTLRRQLDGMARMLGPAQYLTRLRELKDTIPGVYEPRYVASFTRVAPVALWALVEAMGVGMQRILGPELLPVIREGLSGRAARMRT